MKNILLVCSGFCFFLTELSFTMDIQLLSTINHSSWSLKYSAKQNIKLKKKISQQQIKQKTTKNKQAKPPTNAT